MLPGANSSMLQIVQHGIEISRHHLKGVYVFAAGKNRKQSSNVLAEVICTLREGRSEDWEEEEEASTSPSGTKYGPFTLSHQGLHVTMRRWDPDSCVFGAAIHNRLIHFPMRPGRCVFALGCSLKTLSHISDILGPKGRLIGVMIEGSAQHPSAEQIRKFRRAHRNTTIVSEDVQNATLERYERLLSIPQSSRYAFLMALHPRLGSESPARVLAGEDAPKICKRIFEFLQCSDPATVKCLVVCHWPEKTRVDAVREVVLAHIDILQRWKPPSNRLSKEDGDSGANEDGNESPEGEKKVRIVAESRMKTQEEVDSVPQWVFLDTPIDNMLPSNPDADLNMKLMEVVDGMKHLEGGLRTGLLAKEQLLLTPHIPNRSLLLLKYASNRDERQRKVPKKRFPVPPGLEDVSDKDKVKVKDKASSHKAPSAMAMPVPAFAAKGPAPKSAPNMSGASSSSASGSSSALATVDGRWGNTGAMQLATWDESKAEQSDSMQGQGGYGPPGLSIVSYPVSGAQQRAGSSTDMAGGPPNFSPMIGGLNKPNQITPSPKKKRGAAPPGVQPPGFQQAGILGMPSRPGNLALMQAQAKAQAQAQAHAQAQARGTWLTNDGSELMPYWGASQQGPSAGISPGIWDGYSGFENQASALGLGAGPQWPVPIYSNNGGLGGITNLAGQSGKGFGKDGANTRQQGAWSQGGHQNQGQPPGVRDQSGFLADGSQYDQLQYVAISL